MSGWISKAANVFRRDPPNVPQPFEIGCVCGQQHVGIRRQRHQHIVCKECGVSLFVLPKDVYPPPHRRNQGPTRPGSNQEDSGEYDLTSPAPRSRSSGVKPNHTAEFKPSESAAPANAVPDEELAEVLEPDDSIPLAKPPDRSSRRPRPGTIVPDPNRRRSGTRKRRRDDDVDTDVRELQHEPGFVATAIQGAGQFLSSLWQGTRRLGSACFWGFVGFWTPLRLTLGAMVIVAAVTVLFSIRQSLNEAASRVIRERSAAVREAMKKQDWLQARRELEPVIAALDRLGRRDSEAFQLRQQFRETTAMTKLSGVTLLDLISAAEAAVKAGKTSAWEEKFMNTHRGDWLVLEGPVQSIAERVDGRIRKGYELQTPWTRAIATRPVHIRADLPAFAPLGIADESRFVIFAAPLESFQLDTSDNEWHIRLQGTEGFLWANSETYKALGFTFDAIRSEDLITNVLKNQANLMERTE